MTAIAARSTALRARLSGPRGAGAVGGRAVALLVGGTLGAIVDRRLDGLLGWLFGWLLGVLLIGRGSFRDRLQQAARALHVGGRPEAEAREAQPGHLGHLD